MRVRVYAGQDPLTKKRHTLVETIPAGPLAKKQAEAALDRMQREVADRRAPKTDATVDQLLERYLNLFDGSPNTLELYRTHARNHISPLLGHLKVGQLTPETLDSFYAELRRCRRTARAGAIDHRVKGDHECDERCRKHVCKPLSPTTIRHIHYILSGAYRRAVRRRWVSVSPTTQTEPPAAAKPNPQSPSPQEAARILNAAWRDPDWGTFFWVAMTTGARRGELCAIRWSSVNFEAGRETIWLRGAIRRNPGRWAEGGLKTHQQRRIALDPETVDALRVHRGRCESRAQALGIKRAGDAYIFSGAAAGLVLPTPDSLTQRYDRMVRRLGINSTLHKLRHYSATELILSGVDVRTVAGRLGHGGGGTTTLRTYTAWISEADQRAATGLVARMPARTPDAAPADLVVADPRSPFEHVAAALRAQIEEGVIARGDQLPTGKELGTQFGVATATAQRAVALLQTGGLVSAARGRRAVVV